MASSATDAPLLYFSGQCTLATREWVRRWLVANPRGRVAYSFPPFNRPLPAVLEAWKELWGAAPERHAFYDIPCFEPTFRRLCEEVVMRLLINATPEQYRLLPHIGLDRGLLVHVDPRQKNGLAPAVKQMVDMAAEPGCTPDTAQRLRYAAAAVHEFVMAFVAFAAAPDAAIARSDWTALLRKYVRHADCIEQKDRLHVDRVLELFGVTSEEAKEVADRERRREGKPTDLKLRFLSKLLTAYGVVGCVADIVNLLALLTHEWAPTRNCVDSSDVLWSCVDDRLCDHGDLPLRVMYDAHWPTELLGDGEHDDHTVQVAVEQGRFGRPVPVTVQVPYALWETGQHAALAERAALLPDPDSRNAKAFGEANHPRAAAVASA